MVVDENKLVRQKLAIHRYKTASYSSPRRLGILEACTGFGKTYVGIMMIQEINKESPESIINVVVPKIHLKEAWTNEEGYIKEFELKNVNVFVVNSYVKYIDTYPHYLVCSFLLLDECHRYAREESDLFSTVVDITDCEESMALTATLNNKEREFLIKKGFTVFDVILKEEAERNGWVAKSLMFNYGIALSDKDREVYDEIDNRLNYHFNVFEHNFSLFQACCAPKESRHVVTGVRSFNPISDTSEKILWWWATQLGWKGDELFEYTPKKLAEHAAHFKRAMDERKSFLYNCFSKIEVCKEIREFFHEDKRILFFSESSKFANALAVALGPRARAYHSAISSELRKMEQLWR